MSGCRHRRVPRNPPTLPRQRKNLLPIVEQQVHSRLPVRFLVETFRERGAGSPHGFKWQSLVLLRSCLVLGGFFCWGIEAAHAQAEIPDVHIQPRVHPSGRQNLSNGYVV